MLHGWLHSGNPGSACGVVPFLREALALLPAGMSLRCVRADSGFFEEALLAFLEERTLAYVVVARLTTQLKRRAVAIQNWSVVDEHYAVGEFTARLQGWSRDRRFVVVRERVRQASPQQGYRQPATLRAAVFVCGASLDRSGRQVVLHLSASWGGLAEHKPLLDAVLGWRNSTALKLVPPEDQAICAPCRI